MKNIDTFSAEEETTQSLRRLYRERNIDWEPQVYLAEIHHWAREREALGEPDAHSRWTLDDLLQFERIYQREVYLMHPGCGDRSCPECKGDGFVGHEGPGPCDVSRRCSTCMPALGLMFMPKRKRRRQPSP